MRLACQLLCLSLVAAVAACASKPTLRISAERSPAADFSAYRTYRWATAQTEAIPDRPRAGRDLLDWRIRNAIEKQLAARGYVEVSSGKADFVVAYHLDIRERSTESVGDYMDYRDSGGDQGMQEAFVFGYQEGTLVIEVIDAATKRLIWRSAAAPLINPENQQERVREAVQRMMERFPAH